MFRKIGPGTKYESAINIINSNALENRRILDRVVFNPYKFSAYRDSTNQTVTNSTWTQVQLNAVAFDTNSNFDTTTYKYSVPVNGYYQLNGQVAVENITGQQAVIEIAKNTDGTNAPANGGTLLAESTDSDDVSSYRTMTCSALVYLTTTDTVSLVVYIEDTTSPAVIYGSGQTFLSGHLVSQ